VFFFWLVRVFPVEMRHSWRLLSRDLALWLALASLLSVAIAGLPAEPAQGPNAAMLVFIGAAILTTVLPPILFKAAAYESVLDWGAIFKLAASRFFPLMGYSIVAYVVAEGTASVARVASAVLVHGTPVAAYLPNTLATIIYVSILVQLIFFPVLVLLHTREELPPSLWQLQVPIVGELFWPLIASIRMSDGKRWRLAPYVVIGRLAPMLVVLFPPTLILAAMIVAQMLSFTALAVLFDYYLLIAGDLGLKGMSPFSKS